MKPFSLLQLCRIGGDNLWLVWHFPVGLDHFNMSWKKIGLCGLVEFLLDPPWSYNSRLNKTQLQSTHISKHILLQLCYQTYLEGYWGHSSFMDAWNSTLAFSLEFGRWASVALSSTCFSPLLRLQVGLYFLYAFDITFTIKLCWYAMIFY